MIRSMCCRLQLDLRELLKRGNGLFGSAEQTGSLGVVTDQLRPPGLSVHRGDEAELFARLDELLDIGRNSLEIKRKVIQRHDGRRPLPLYQALSRHAAQSFLHARRQRHQRDDPQLHRRRARHHHATGAMLSPCASSTTSAPGSSRSRKRRAICTTWKPRRPKAPPTASPRRTTSASPTSCRPARRTRPTTPTPSQLPGRLHRRSVRGAGAAGRAAAQIHRRHRAAPLYERAHLLAPKRARSWCGARWSISGCPTSPSRRPSRSAPSTAISAASTRSARNATTNARPQSASLHAEHTARRKRMNSHHADRHRQDVEP